MLPDSEGGQLTEIQKTVSYSAVVDSVPEAFAVVMGKLDEFAAPSISIRPVHVYAELGIDEDDVHGGAYSFMYSVTVEGDVE